MRHVNAFAGDQLQEVREVRHNGKWVSLGEPALLYSRGHLRCHAGLAGGAQKKQVAGPVRAQIAQILLDSGCQIKRISDIVEQLSKKADPQEIDRILQTTEQQGAANALYSLAERLNIATPKKWMQRQQPDREGRTSSSSVARSFTPWTRGFSQIRMVPNHLSCRNFLINPQE